MNFLKELLILELEKKLKIITFYLFLEHYDVGNAFNIVIVVVNREAIQSVAFISKHGKVDLE